MWRTAMKRKGRVSEKQTANDDRDERNDIAFTRFGVDVDIDGVPERGKADYLDEIIEPVLDIDVFRAPDMSVLINLQNVARMPPASDLFDNEPGVRAPAIIGRRIIRNLQVFVKV